MKLVKKFQVVEKNGFGTDWSLVRYADKALDLCDTEEEALKFATDYITSVNFTRSALTTDEKISHFTIYMPTKDNKCYLGVLDGRDVVLQDEWGKFVTYVPDNLHWMIRDKVIVSVREVPVPVNE